MTIQTAMAELFAGLYSRLSSDPTLSAKVTGVYSSVEEDNVHPYVTISEPISVPFTTKLKFGEDLSVVISAWSLYDGDLEAIKILNLCLDALATRMPLNGFKIIKIDVDEIRVFKDADPRIRHGILRMKYTIQNN